MEYIVLTPSPPTSDININTKGAAEGGVKLIAKAMRWLHEVGFEKQIKKSIESDAIIEKISSEMSDNQGVLIEINYCEWELPDFNGSKAKSFLSTYVVGAGDNPESVLRLYLQTTRLSGSLGRGWIVKHIYIWVKNKDFNNSKFYYDHNPKPFNCAIV